MSGRPRQGGPSPTPQVKNILCTDVNVTHPLVPITTAYTKRQRSSSGRKWTGRSGRAARYIPPSQTHRLCEVECDFTSPVVWHRDSSWRVSLASSTHLHLLAQAVVSSHMNRRVQNFDLLMTRRIRSILLVSGTTPAPRGARAVFRCCSQAKCRV